MRMYDVIKKKRDGMKLSADEISFFIRGCVSGEIPDEQIAALLMAIYINGMCGEETDALTKAMAYSGYVQDLSAFQGTVDKHSTGGVGDKTSLIVAPIVAANGCTVAKMSGRSLGHTGGTIDKLESIPGFRTSLSPDEFERQLSDIGIVIASQSGEMAPADKKIYALRDLTATIESIPLIASSIMSKKLAAGAESIVLDVKTGKGAFMTDIEKSRALANEMIRIGKASGKKVAALITDMDAPLGNAVGNSLEVEEAVSVLRGEGPSDLTELCLALASHMISLSRNIPFDNARAMAERSLYNRDGLEKLRELIIYQHGDPDIIESPELMHKAPIKEPVISESGGFISAEDALCIGNAALALGAGRESIGASIDHSAGVLLLVKPGDRVEKGQPLAVLHGKDANSIIKARQIVLSSLSISEQPVPARPILLDVLHD